MKRIDAIRLIMNTISDELVIVSNGMISREVFYVCDRPQNFYMLGSMGCALAIGIGVAYTRPDLKVVVISGDGAALMGLSTFVLHKKLGLPNLTHYILDNNCHATTGGQKTASDAVDFEALAPNTKRILVSREQGEAPRIPLHPIQIKRRFMDAIYNKQKKQSIF
jgi:thiamine pyrophosphate-dependent acetolactate synthase large subunit-like protein